jgi:hypothetical protein
MEADEQIFALAFFKDCTACRVKQKVRISVIGIVDLKK